MDSEKRTTENKKPPRERKLRSPPEISEEQREAYENIPKMNRKQSKKMARKLFKGKSQS